MAVQRSEIKSYAYLPEDLLVEILKRTPVTAAKLSNIISTNASTLESGLALLYENDRIRTLSDGCVSGSLVAVDGANIIEKMTSCDVLMAIAVGVEGLPEEPSEHWAAHGEQFYQWQEALPHHVANARLCQGIMFLMELSILANAHQEYRILDGSHITSILKINSLLSAKAEEFADEHYVAALQTFLRETYGRVIPDIPDIIDNAFRLDSIVGLVKYSSSRELLSSILGDLNIAGDDKTYLSAALRGDQYITPFPVGQYNKERDQWDMVHIKCNLELNINEAEKEELNVRLMKTLERFRPSRVEGTDLYVTYFKPFDEGICYRIEMKRSLALDEDRLQRLLRSLKQQTFFPTILEPYPQYLADVIVKNISFGMDAALHAIRSDERLQGDNGIKLMLSYRSK